MLTLNEIQKQYTNDLYKFDRGLVREYLQYQILSIIFNHKISNKLCFIGGTCLRIAYNLNRFSEDLDFDNNNLSYDEFLELSKYIEKEMGKLGFEVDIKVISKGAFHCYVKFPKLLFQQGLSAYQEEKILIQIDTFDQKSNYKKEPFILNKFALFTQISVAPKPIILAQKLWTITQRKRFKGRDFYDAMFLLQNTKPDINFLQDKFETKDLELIKQKILDKIENIDWNKVINDVKPFLHNSKDAEKIRLFSQFLKQTNLSQ